jgi:hypothetical protein
MASPTAATAPMTAAVRVRPDPGTIRRMILTAAIIA